MTPPAQRPYKPKHPPLAPLRAVREAYGLSRAALTERITEQGVTVAEATIRTVENGHDRPSNELITAWAKALRLNPADVILPPQNGNGDGRDKDAA
jgi:transcriptional regulator with XRE-family HTH domain